MPNESSTLPVLPRFGDPDSWAANVATKQNVADAKLAATSGSTTQTSIAISGTGGAGFISLPTQSSAPAAPASGFALYANATGKFSWRNAADTYSRSFEMTATADRTFTLPDASFTFAGQNLANTFSLAQTFSANGALSAPAVSITGTPITGGSASTTQGLVKIGGGTSGGLSTSGTMLEIQAPAAFAGDLQCWSVNGTQKANITAGGSVILAAGATFSASSTGDFRLNNDTLLTRKAAANWQLGVADAASPIAQTLSVQSVVAGTSNTAGVDFMQKASAGTGTGPGGAFNFQIARSSTTGSTQNSFATALRINSSSEIWFGSAGSSAAPAIFPCTGSTYSSTSNAGRGLTLWNYSNTAGDIGTTFSGSNMTQTSGTQRNLYVIRSFAPTSGTGIYNHFEIAPTINQTGGASGVTRGIYVNPTLTAAADFRALEISAGNVVLPKTVTAGGTTGAQTIDKVTGSVNFAAAATSLVVTNSLVTANSIIMCTIATNDTTAAGVKAVAGAGSFTIYLGVAPTAETRVNFFVTN